jgi:hypothetical protein
VPCRSPLCPQDLRTLLALSMSLPTPQTMRCSERVIRGLIAFMRCVPAILLSALSLPRNGDASSVSSPYDVGALCSSLALSPN